MSVILIVICICITVITLACITKMLVIKGMYHLTNLIRTEERASLLSAISTAAWWYSEDPITLAAMKTFSNQLVKHQTVYSDQFQPRDEWRKILLELESERTVASDLGVFWRPISCNPSKPGVYVCRMQHGNNLVDQFIKCRFDGKSWRTITHVLKEGELSHWINNPA